MNPRLLIVKLLDDVIYKGKALQFNKDIEKHPQASFIKEVCFGTLRFYHQLNAISELLFEKPLKSKDLFLKTLTISALYQLKYLQKPDHATINETVNCCKPLKREWAKGLINACLRRFLREEAVLFSKLSQSNMASHPKWMIDSFEKDWPGESTKIIEQNNQRPPMFIRINPQKTSIDEYTQCLTEKKIEFKKIDLSLAPYALLITTPIGAYELPFFREGHASIQDLAAQCCASAIELQPNMRVLDMCAAPGGKSAAMYEQCPTIELTCVENGEDRFKKMLKGFRRLEVKPQHTFLMDALELDEEKTGGLFDRIVIDAPCSGTGVIRRHPDIKLLRRESDIANNALLQTQLLERAWTLLKPGGIMVYATCSILKDENETQVIKFLNQHQNAKLQDISDFGQKTLAGSQVLPGDLEMDGFFMAKILKINTI